MSDSPLPVIAFTVALGEGAQAEARQCEATFRHWHPEIPFVCIDDDSAQLLSGGKAPAWGGELLALRALAGWFLSGQARRVVYLDADVFVMGRLEGLLDSDETTLTADWSTFTMRVPDAPRINNGVLASSAPAFWQAWTAALFTHLAPAVEQSDFDQLTLRLLVMAGAVLARVIDGQPGSPYYNVSIHEIAGEWRVDNGATYKGAERVLVYHQAGLKERGIAAAPEGLRAQLAEMMRERLENGPRAAGPDFEVWWHRAGEGFSRSVKEQFAQWPIATLESVVPDVYARSPGAYRTLAPLAYDRGRRLEGTGWERSGSGSGRLIFMCGRRFNRKT